MYNTYEAGNMPFYGKVYGTGNVVLDGGNNAMTVDASLTTGNNTSFTYITGVTTEAASNQFITFVDKPPSAFTIMWKPIFTTTLMCVRLKRTTDLLWISASTC